MNKVIAGALGLGATILGIAIFKKNPTKVVETVSNVTETFGGVPKDAIDAIAKDTYKGVGTKIVGDTLQYFYKSQSGKTTNSASFEVDEDGNLFSYGTYPQSCSMRAFGDALYEAIHEND